MLVVALALALVGLVALVRAGLHFLAVALGFGVLLTVALALAGIVRLPV